MRKLLLMGLTALLLASCKFDSSRVIGVELHSNSLPYGRDGFSGRKYIDGIHYRTYSTYYNKKALMYILDDQGYIRDYFFSNIVKFDEVKDIPAGTDYREVVAMLGEPPALIYRNLYMEYSEAKEDRIYCKYFEKKFDFYDMAFELSPWSVLMIFDQDGKLLVVTKEYRRDGDW